MRRMVSEGIQEAVIDLKIDDVGGLVQEELDAGRPPLEILDDLKSGLDEVGRRFEENIYFLSELFMAAETMKAALKVLQPHLKGGITESRGKVLIGTVLGDVHDFGKSIVGILLSSKGFEVIDLGVDIEPKIFAEKAAQERVDVVGISALLSTTQPLTADVVKALEENGVRDKVKVILGGAAVDESAVEKYGVDAAVHDAAEGIRIIESWMEEKK